MWNQAFPNPIPNRFNHALPLVIKDQSEFEISDILDTKIDNRRAANSNTLSMEGYEGTDEKPLGSTPLTWNATELVADFHLAFPSKPGPLSNLKVQTTSLLLKFSFYNKSTKSYYSLRVKSGTSLDPDHFQPLCYPTEIAILLPPELILLP